MLWIDKSPHEEKAASYRLNNHHDFGTKVGALDSIKSNLASVPPELSNLSKWNWVGGIIWG